MLNKLMVTLKTLSSKLSPSKQICFISFNESSLKMMKNVFYFILKTVFILKIMKLFLTLWSCRKNSLIRNISLISKFITSQPA